MAYSSQSFTAPSIPKLNRRTISSPLSSSASKISGVAPKLKTSRMRFFRPSLKKTNVTAEAITQKSSIENTLAETNTILVEIQKQLSLDFAMRIAEEKEKNKVLTEDKSKRRLALKEGAVESTKNIGGAIKSTVSKVTAPLKGFFDKLLEFIKTLGLGIGANAVFKWLENEENREKLTRFFNIIKENGTLVKNILKTFGAIFVGGKILGALSALKKVFLLLANPMFLAGVGIIIAAARQGLGKEQKEVLKYLEDELGGITVENRKKMIEMLKSQREPKLPDGKPNPNYIWPTNLAGRAEISRKIKFLETGEYDYGGKKAKLDFGFADFLTITQGSKYNFDTGEIESTSPDGSKPGIDLFRGKREMGGPVTAGQTYLVGERGPEFFIPNINGSVVNNYKTEKIYKMISSKNAGKVNFVTMDLPPQVMKTEKSIPSPPAPEVPNISSTNVADLWRNKTPDIYGIYV